MKTLLLSAVTFLITVSAFATESLVGEYLIKSYKGCTLGECFEEKPVNMRIIITETAEKTLRMVNEYDNEDNDGIFDLVTLKKEFEEPGVFIGTVDKTKVSQVFKPTNKGFNFNWVSVTYMVFVRSGKKELAEHMSLNFVFKKTGVSTYSLKTKHTDRATSFPLSLKSTYILEKLP